MIKQFLGHLHTINHHKWLVTRDCIRVGLISQGLKHDLSKYAPIEFLAGVKYYEGGKRSPINREKEEKGYSQGWLHHKGRNRHHFEYWLDYPLHLEKGLFPLQPVQMPRRYVAEMLMDRICASKNYNKESYTQHDPLQYFKHGRGTSMLHPQTAKELHGMLRILDERGEEVLIRFVKEYYLKGYKI